ncbi:restriction endonuclease subunit S [Altererythrobacter soli]|uniref:Restriction endonuclease subunit S n=1 Tax=Croceibacterium soli TaxID=1739690 RepID=A0A6I4UVJ0_9SPHN|nr:restriction endonuclease subunit S [Croceibacterium soli]MXP41874.1 restriction endonuclease subunit S [Croceibacterium soli]
MSWSTVSLGELVEFKGGGTPDKKVERYWNGGIPWASVKDFKSAELDSTVDTISELGLKNSASNLIPRGTIIVPTRMAVGKAAIAGMDLAINQDLKALFPKGDIDTRYLLHALLASSEKLVRFATGATVKGITLDVLRQLEIPLPSMPEQRRIAAILDEADALRLLRRRSLSGLSGLGQARFEQMFGAVQGTVPLEDAVEGTLIGLVRSAEQFGEHFSHPYVRMDAITRNGQFAPALVQRTNVNAAELDRYTLKDGDLLFNTRNSRDLVGKTAIFRGMQDAVFNNNIMRIRFGTHWDSAFVEAYFRSRAGRRELEKRKSGTTSVWAVYWSKLKSFPLPQVPYDKQIGFRRFIEATWKQEEELKSELLRYEGLFASLQHRAFRGEL